VRAEGRWANGREKWMLDLVALGTVADMMPLTDENRTMVKYGLLVMAQTKRVGLRELFKVSRVLPRLDREKMRKAFQMMLKRFLNLPDQEFDF